MDFCVLISLFPLVFCEEGTDVFFFQQCGTINSINIITEKDGRSSTATVEFDTKEDVLAAQTKDGKSVEGRAIEVQIGTGSTLYVTNFPPSADEAYIRDLFKGVSFSHFTSFTLLLSLSPPPGRLS